MSEKKTPQTGNDRLRSIQDRPLGQPRRAVSAADVQSDRPVVRRAPAAQPVQPAVRAPQQTGAAEQPVKTAQNASRPARPAAQAPGSAAQNARPAAPQRPQQPVRQETERVPVRQSPARQVQQNVQATEATERQPVVRRVPQEMPQEVRYQTRQQRQSREAQTERIDPTQRDRANWKEKQAARKRRRRTMQLIAAIAAVVAVLSIFAAVLAVDLGGGANTFYEGVSVDGLKLNGYTMEEAEEKLLVLNSDRISAMAVHLTYDGREWTISPEQMGIELDIEEKLQQAWELGREGNIFKRQKEIRKLRKEGVQLSTIYSYDIEKVKARLNEVKQSIDLPATDATVAFDPSKEERFTIVQERSGRAVDLDALLTEVINQLDNGYTKTITVQPDPVSPTMFATDLEKATERISRVKTDLGSSSESRIHNIKTALSYFNGMVVQPGQEVSFNQTTGPRGLEQGYQNAGVIQDDEIIDGPGGGVCQASTTLYQAVVKAGLEIVRSNKHSLPVSYVDVGTDAAVAYDYKDLVFRNNTEYPIFIEGRVSGSSVVVSVYGYPLEEGTEIKIVTDVYEKVQPAETKITLDTDAQYVTYTDETYVKKKAREGVKVKSYRVIYKDGQEVSREKLRDDYYKEVQGETYQGVTPRDGSVVVPEEND